MDAFAIHQFEKLVAVAGVDVDTDDDRTVDLECAPEHRSDLIWGADYQAHSAEGFCVSHDIDRTELNT